LVKIGFFRHIPGDDYWENVSAARRALEGFVRLSERTGVKTVYQTHSGNCLGSNCAGIMHLLGGLDARWIGAHVDGGHMAINGEDIEMGLAMCREYLTVIGAKDARYVPDRRPNAPAPYGPAFVFLGQGAAHWSRLLKTVKQRGFDGPITVHTEYTEDQEVVFTVGGKDLSAEAGSRRKTGVIEDLAFLRRKWDKI
jgi:sugar phosphate isomerase/epimerase